MRVKFSSILVFAVLLSTLKVCSQNELSKSENDLFAKFEKIRDSDSTLTVEIEQSRNYLSVSIEKNDKHVREFFFDYPIVDETGVPDPFFSSECDSIVYKFYCAACLDVYFEGQKHKSWKWIELEEGHYVSRTTTYKETVNGVKKIGRPEMWLRKSLNEEIVGSIHISVREETKAEWKNIFEK